MYLYELKKEKETKKIFDFEFACVNVHFFTLNNINS